jgi:hypothetical protein
MGAINVITLQGYYYLYALYFDYPLNNAFFANEENHERVRESLRTVQRLRALVQPYRKSWPVRLFTERDAMARFSPDAVNTMLFQLRELVTQLGPPPGWSRGPLPAMRPPRQRRHSRTAAAKPAPAPSAPMEARRPPCPFPKPPLPFRLTG